LVKSVTRLGGLVTHRCRQGRNIARIDISAPAGDQVANYADGIPLLTGARGPCWAPKTPCRLRARPRLGSFHEIGRQPPSWHWDVSGHVSVRGTHISTRLEFGARAGAGGPDGRFILVGHRYGGDGVGRKVPSATFWPPGFAMPMIMGLGVMDRASSSIRALSEIQKSPANRPAGSAGTRKANIIQQAGVGS